MSAVLVAGAAAADDPGGFYPELLAAADVVIAADGAGEWCAALGRVPDVTVGDFDSASPGAAARLAAAGSAVVTLPAAKDISDLDACVVEARSRGASAITFTAAFSDRVDHTLAALGTFVAAADLRPRIEEPGWWAETVGPEHGPLRLELPGGVVFTVVSPSGARGVTIEGARYSLREAVLGPLSSRGLSNVSTGEAVTIRVAGGTLMVVVQR